MGMSVGDTERTGPVDRPPRRSGPLVLAALAWLATLAVGRGVLALPEQCRPLTVDGAREAAGLAVGWFDRNQLPDGRWLYRYDRDADVLDERPHLVRHAGVTMSLYQADAAGIAGARRIADRGTAWALDRLIDAGDGRAVALEGVVPTGGSALLTAGLAIRRATTGDPRYDDELDGMGRFLVSMIEPSGAVLANWDPATGAPVPGRYSIFFTGEALWALTMLATVDPDGGWVEPAERVARYLSTERDDAEDLFPPLSDHWGAYGLAQLAIGAGRVLGDDERRYAERLAAIFGIQVRYESQRTGEGLNEAVLRGGRALGAGVGTLGEGLGSLYLLATTPGAAGDREAAPGSEHVDVLAERLVCVASLLADRQVRAEEAATTGHPEAAEGAWFTGSSTQKDDQQHALSALLLAGPAIASGFDIGRSSDEAGIVRTLWLAVVAAAAANPLRVGAALAAVRRREVLSGAAVTGMALAAAAVAASGLLRSIDVSPSTAAVAAGMVLAVSAAVDLVTRPPAPFPVVPRRAWLCPVLFPVLLRPAPVLVVLAVAASVGTGAGLVAALAVVVGGAAHLARPSPSRGVAAALGRLFSAVAIVGGVDLVFHGVFSV